MRIRKSSKLVVSLPPLEQRAAQDSYAVALRATFIFAAVCALVGFVIRIPVSIFSVLDLVYLSEF